MWYKQASNVTIFILYITIFPFPNLRDIQIAKQFQFGKLPKKYAYMVKSAHASSNGKNKTIDARQSKGHVLILLFWRLKIRGSQTTRLNFPPKVTS